MVTAAVGAGAVDSIVASADRTPKAPTNPAMLTRRTIGIVVFIDCFIQMGGVTVFAGATRLVYHVCLPVLSRRAWFAEGGFLFEKLFAAANQQVDDRWLDQIDPSRQSLLF